MKISIAGLLLVMLAPPLRAQSSPTPFDLVIEHGRIIDGTGSPWYTGDLGIRGGRIAAIGHLADAKARQRIDAHGLIVAPGFIDITRGINTNRAIHTGDIFGLPSKAVLSLASLLSVLQVVSGVVMWLKRTPKGRPSSSG